MTRLDGVDHVFHEAAIPSIPRSVDPPLPSNHANITGTLTLLEGVRRIGTIKRFVYAASLAARLASR